jgi:hypothetical protein
VGKPNCPVAKLRRAISEVYADHRADVRGGDIAEIGWQFEAIGGAKRRSRLRRRHSGTD